MDYTPEIIEEKFDALPDDIKNTLTSEETANALKGIGTKNGLLEDRMTILINETGFVMLGLTHPSQFVGNLTTAMGISRENAQRIAAAVNESVFAPIRESLKRIHNIGMPVDASALSTLDTGNTKKLDIEPAVLPHAEKLENITMRPREEIHPLDEHVEQQGGRPQNISSGDPYREPL